ncbi:PfkB family carbohydrate kinase [Nodosilinea sp. E11]|uniref:PfkB family carbohydrate kinase n=1 Tax=Nodosilinea sp. E11 TaxID=3037479 RepID=UPI002934A720|nr:PfkB family carbohydrate kinase [Nodosilinea sp. E11]WOD39371.1 PfkB family carbohydrate kinase [Nodosilinea sp. E11]
MATGLFIGLMTLDCIYRVSQVPGSNEKIVAEDSLLVAGGPATNAAIAFAALGNRAIVMGALGQHPLATMIRTELAGYGVEVVDLTPDLAVPPPLSTILVTAATGDRAVVSRNAVGRQVQPPDGLEPYLSNVDIMLIDGHQMALGQALAAQAQSQGIPVVIDAGSWKPGFDRVLSLATSAIAAAKFSLPGHPNTLTTLAALGIAEVAITHGAEPLQICDRGQYATLPVPQVTVQDTLGAGDIFHGAFCHYRLQSPFTAALSKAAQIAAQSCQHFGPRAWIKAV